jgi:HEPN domain-containing protein
MKKQVENWILFAENDLSAAEAMLKDYNHLTNIIVFHCQQSVEKYMKAFLIENDVPLVKTHDLIKLNKMIKKIKDLDIDENKLDVINEVYTESRYPFDLGMLPDGMPTVEQAKEFVEYAKEIKTIINFELNKI